MIITENGNKIRLVLLFLFNIMIGITARGADVVSVSGLATYYDDGTHSRVECERLAAEQARIDALAKKFGTIVSQDILQADRIVGNREQNDFLALSATEVKGEWIADEGKPEYEYSRDAKENLIVTCRIKGKAKEISNEAAAFDALVLRNGTRKANADNRFRDGDDMFLYFNTSVNGFLSVFLEDEEGKVYLLLPYPKDTRTRVAVKKDTEYIFFSPDHVGDQIGADVEEVYLTGSDHTEYNRVFVVFSPEYFSRPVMDASQGLPVMKSEEFNKWLIKSRRNDSRMNVKSMNLQIMPKS